jgi:ribosomal protein S18 acetylase RimI-like enzyme
MIEISNSKKSKEKIFKYLKSNSSVFVPPLSGRVDLNTFTEKITKYARQTWIYDNEQNEIAGFMACYFNDPKKEIAYITSISIVEKYQAKGLGIMLINDSIDFAKKNNFRKIQLEVSKINTNAIGFYRKQQFNIVDCSFLSFYMVKNLNYTN